MLLGYKKHPYSSQAVSDIISIAILDCLPFHNRLLLLKVLIMLIPRLRLQ